MVAVSAVATSPAGTISTSPARGRFRRRPDVLSARVATSFVTASEVQRTPCTTVVGKTDSQSCCGNVIAARLRRARAALSWEETHDARFVRPVCGKDAQPGVQGDFTRSCMMLVRRYLSLRSCLRSCGQVLGTPPVGCTTQP